MKLRPYQNNIVASVFDCWKENTSSLVVAPTGTGKTVIFASVIRRIFPRRAMVLAHRQELIFQARDKIQKVTGLTVDVEMGEFKARTDKDLFHPKASVIVSTVQTHIAGGDGGGRMGKFDPKDFGLLIIDEAHHATSPSYRKIIDYYRTNPKLKVLGVTATPDRSDEEALGQVFDAVAFDYEILDAIKDGWLVPIEQQMVSVESLDFSSVRTTAGDLNGADLAAVMESEKNLHGIASATIDIIGSRRGIGFASSVNHAQILADIFNRHSLGMANCVSAKTDKEDRKKIIYDFAQGKIQFLWNCGVFTEGFDDSGVEVISMARPTKSRALYAQMAGRATRPHESIAHTLNDITIPALRRSSIARSVKPSCLIVDFVGNSGKHKLMTTADILSGNMSDEVIEAAITYAKKSGKPMRMDKTMLEEEERQAEIKARKLAEEARKARLVGKATYKSQSIDPFALLQIKPVASSNRGWDKKPASEKMRNILRKNIGVNPDEFDFGQTRQLVTEFFRRIEQKLCTVKQMSLLKKHGVEAKDFTFTQASKAIDAIAKNGWSKPANLQQIITETTQAPKVAQPGDLEPDDIPF